MADDRPAWARRMTNERTPRSWSQADAVRAMQAHATEDEHLPAADTLLRNWKRWEAGEVEPDRGKGQPFYKPIIARTFVAIQQASKALNRTPMRSAKCATTGHTSTRA